MRITVCCKKCKESIRIKEYVDDRCELARKRGKNFKIRCDRCGAENDYKINEVSAKPGMIGIITLILLCPTMGVLFWLVYPYAMSGGVYIFILPLALLIPIIVYLTILSSINRRVKIFNSSRC